ncbi:hypothetical protein AAKU64_003400 [Undibacterium sp. GrIS 1.8]
MLWDHLHPNCTDSAAQALKMTLKYYITDRQLINHSGRGLQHSPPQRINNEITVIVIIMLNGLGP